MSDSELLVMQLQAADPRKRQAAARKLTMRECTGEEIAALIATLRDPVAAVQFEAASTLSIHAFACGLSVDAHSAICPFLRTLDPVFAVKILEIFQEQVKDVSLWRIRKACLPDIAERQVARLVGSTSDDISLRAIGVLQLQSIKQPLAALSVFALTEVLNSQCEQVAIESAFALQRQSVWQSLPEQSVMALLALRRHSDSCVRSAVNDALTANQIWSRPTVTLANAYRTTADVLKERLLHECVR